MKLTMNRKLKLGKWAEGVRPPTYPKIKPVERALSGEDAIRAEILRHYARKAGRAVY